MTAGKNACSGAPARRDGPMAWVDG